MADPSPRGDPHPPLWPGSVTRPPDLEICQWGLFGGMGLAGWFCGVCDFLFWS